MSKNTHKTQLWQQIVFGVQIQVIFGFSSIMPDVIGNFVEGDSNSVEGAAHFNNSIMSCQCLKLVGGCDKRQPCVLGHSSCQSCVKALLGVQSCAAICGDALLSTVENIFGFLSEVLWLSFLDT